MSPFTAYLGTGQSIEELGQQPLTLGAGLGGQAAAYGANAGASLLRGGLGAALTQQQANQISPLGGFLQGASKDPKLQTGFERLFGINQPYETYSGYQVGPPQQGQTQPYPYTSFSFNGQQI